MRSFAKTNESGTEVARRGCGALGLHVFAVGVAVVPLAALGPVEVVLLRLAGEEVLVAVAAGVRIREREGERELREEDEAHEAEEEPARQALADGVVAPGDHEERVLVDHRALDGAPRAVIRDLRSRRFASFRGGGVVAWGRRSSLKDAARREQFVDDLVDLGVVDARRLPERGRLGVSVEVRRVAWAGKG